MRVTGSLLQQAIPESGRDDRLQHRLAVEDGHVQFIDTPPCGGHERPGRHQHGPVIPLVAVPYNHTPPHRVRSVNCPQQAALVTPVLCPERE